MSSSADTVAGAVQLLQDLSITVPDHSGEATNSAAHRVFRIPELFDLIVFRLSSKQLFLVRRVDRMWRDYLSRSKALKIEMFLLSGPATTDPAKVELNLFVDPNKYYTLHDTRRASFLPNPAWKDSESSLSRTLLVRPVMKDARLSIILRVKDLKDTYSQTPPRMLTVQIEPDSTLEDVQKAIDSAIVDKTLEQVSNFSVYSTRVYADGVWRGDDRVIGKVVQSESAQERCYWLEWERYEREGPEEKAEVGLRMLVLGEMVQVW
ncbi:hypothetical protein LTR56_011630 [Elasticomyces elasticus]|nr:hypothetical protein LTR56_011630 [Elasticomyces elasticus]KAK3647963.1 hypothetical protein LTR22_013576 [Elasticomyces elasticus]KAK4905334.1 hypothetical protein LTR49_025357 [Elasticomyces elasticus]KAK5765336.1 hypothetical protein LTS12_004593 [Elasticomyces elasticus]